MNNTKSAETQNASLDRYLSTQDTDTAEVDTETDTPVEAGLVAIDDVEDQHIQDLLEELDDDEIRGLVDSMLDAGNILSAVAEVTSDEELESNIDAVTAHYAERPSLVEAAGDSIEEALGMRPFELQITEPENEHMTPMVSLTVEEDVVLTDNPSINAELVEHATRMRGETESGQRHLFDDWKDAIGGDRVAEFKRDRDADALGFSLPGQIPATGDVGTRTPITEIPYIGVATAAEIHPTGDLMSINDYLSLTDKQHAWLDMPVDNTDYDNQRVRGIARGVVDLVPEKSTELLGRALDMMDRRDTDEEMEFVSPSRVFGIIRNPYLLHDAADVSAVTQVEFEEDAVTVTTEDGVESRYPTAEFRLLEAVSEVTEATILAGDECPASLELPDGSSLIVAPRLPNDN